MEIQEALREPDDRWEMGSEFHWDVADLRVARTAVASPLPEKYEFFSSFTGALRSLVGMLPERRTLHLPSYFWMGMIDLLLPYVEIRCYREIPDGSGPDLDSLAAEPGDVVLAVNMFGQADRRPWDEWASVHDDVLVVEDHTHDPFSEWAATSTADFCISSLRKTVPVPDGAPVWSPAGRPLPRPDPDESIAAHRKLTAMLLKAAWLRGTGLRKADFRELQTTGEQALSAGVHSPTAYTRSVLDEIDVVRLRQARIDNVDRLLAGLRPRAEMAPLTYASPGAAPFNVQLMCADGQVRDALRAYLAQHSVYAPVHWKHPRHGPGSVDSRAVDLGGRMLTLPVDHRYTPTDVDRLLEVLESFG